MGVRTAVYDCHTKGAVASSQQHVRVFGVDGVNPTRNQERRRKSENENDGRFRCLLGLAALRVKEKGVRAW